MSSPMNIDKCYLEKILSIRGYEFAKFLLHIILITARLHLRCFNKHKRTT